MSLPNRALVFFLISLSAPAQTVLRLGEPVAVNLPATTTSRVYSGPNGFQVGVPPDASRLLVRFEDYRPNLFAPYGLLVRPEFDLPVENANYTTLGYWETDGVRTIVFPLDYRRATSTYYIGFETSARSSPIVGILTATVERIEPGMRLAVPSTANLLLAGEADGTRLGTFAAPANSPPSLPVTPGQPLEIEADGGIEYRVGSTGTTIETQFMPPAGSPISDSRGAKGGIVVMTAPRGALVAVFAGEGRVPFVSTRFEGGPADTFRIRPERPMGEADQRLVRPVLNEPFYVGSGRTTTRRKKVFVPPPGATRVYFGIFENTNEFVYTGSASVTMRQSSLPAPEPSGVEIVPGQTQIYLAGRRNNDLVTYSGVNYTEHWHSPVRANIELTPGTELEFFATNFVILGLLGLSEPNGTTTVVRIPGGPQFTGGTGPGLGFGGITAPRGSLVGIFLGDAIDGTLRPPDTNANPRPTDARIAPALQQVFFIGTGLNGNQPRRYVVPPGARQLFLGVHQSGDRAGIVAYKVGIGVRSAFGPTVNAITNAAGFGTSVSPGQIASLFGANLGPLTTADTVPLPRQLAGVEVWFDEFRAPLYFVSPTQINVQVPWELSSRERVLVSVRRDNVPAPPISFLPRAFSGGMFTTEGNIPVVVNARTGGLVTAAAPARRGDTLVIYSSGQGPVLPPTRSGEPASSATLSRALYPFKVAFTGLLGTPVSVAEPVFSGLAPGLIGVYQFNVVVPNDAPAGNGKIRFESDINLLVDYPFSIAAP